ncbi:MAG: hypothetical protein ACR2PW_05265 [Gammaproteobacteria bacterium]
MNSSVAIERVETRRQKREFLYYPFAKYRDDPLWAPPFMLSESHRLDPAHNPFFRNAEIAFLLARTAQGTVCGRIAVFVDAVHNKTHNENTAMFGLFEAADAAAARQLLSAAEGWAKSHSAQQLRGPISLTMEEGVGFKLDSFHIPAYVMMPYNGPDYPQWMQESDYQIIKQLYAWSYYGEPQGRRRMRSISERIFKRLGDRVSMRQVNLLRFSRDMNIVFSLYNQAWQENWGARPKSKQEYMFVAADLRLVLDTRFTAIIEIDGQPVAAMVCIPDGNQLTKKMNGHILPFGWWHFLRKSTIIKRMRMAIMGVLPEWRGKGLEAALIWHSMQAFDQSDYEGAECSWVLEDNQLANQVIAGAGGDIYQRYGLYQKKLG